MEISKFFIIITIIYTCNCDSNKDVFISSFIEQQITLTCKINLDQQNFSTSGDYKVSLKI